MEVNTKSVHRALFKSVDAEGSQWLFAVGLNGGWKITRNGKQIAVGTATLASIDTGIEKFLSLTRVIADSDAACHPAVGAQLDRIERGRSAPGTVANSQGRIRPHAPKRSSAYLTTYGTIGP